MRRLASVVAFVVLVACGRAEPALPLDDALLAAANRWGKGADRTAFARAELDRISERVRERAAASSAASALARVVFEEFAFAREVDDQSLEYVLLPSVLEGRRGSCVGLGSLYLALAERLGLPMHGVLLPGHFFVVLEEQGASRSIELLHRGEVMSEGWHRRRFGAPAARAYGRALTRDEVLGVVEYDVGNQRKRAGRLHQAQQAFESARRHFPDFAEAHASAGAVAHLLGLLDVSLEAYRAAQRANPELPGVAANLALLVAERDRDRLALPP
jgi:tetratricopeptide (TPR) repeat protein